MDKQFLNRAEQFSTFNFSGSDLTHLTYKNEVRHLVNKHWFPEKNEDVYLDDVEKENINKSIHKLKSINSDSFKRLYSYNIKGIGPGEVLMYYLIDGAQVGGGSSAGVDLTVNGKDYEIKAVKTVFNKVLDSYFLNDFKLGGTVNLTEIMQGLQEIGKVSKTELAGSKINEFRYTKDFKELEKQFRELASEYFKEHNIIFLDNSNKKYGEVIDVGKVKKENIYIERMTSGTIKPLIKLDKN